MEREDSEHAGDGGGAVAEDERREEPGPGLRRGQVAREGREGQGGGLPFVVASRHVWPTCAFFWREERNWKGFREFFALSKRELREGENLWKKRLNKSHYQKKAKQKKKKKKKKKTKKLDGENGQQGGRLSLASPIRRELLR